MKKLLLVLGAILFASTLIVGDLFAYTYSHTTSYTRTQSRAATVSTPDSMYYNAAGLVKVKDGLYLDIGDQMGAKNWETSIMGDTIYDKTPSFLIPNLGIAYKNGRGALFLALYVPDGGGTVNYQQNSGIQGARLLGIPIAPQYIKATSFWIQGSAGGSFAITDWMALTAGMKVSNYMANMSMGLDDVGTFASQKSSAYGFSGFAGILITPMEMLNIPVLYSSKVIARGKMINLKTHYSQIDEQRLPDYLLMGINVKPIESVEIQFSYQMNFTQEIDWASDNTAAKEIAFATLTNTTGGSVENNKGRLQHKVGLGAEFQVHKMILISAGVSYESQDVYNRGNLSLTNVLNASLQNWGVGFGLRITPIEQLSIDLGVARYFYVTDRTLYNGIKFNKETWSWGIGLTGKVL